jgi:predicted flap endonuclease-1-like 5' DNA nuclease
MANRAMDTSADDGPMLAGSAASVAPASVARESVAPESDGGRESGIVEVERKASAVTGGVTGALASTLTSTTSDRLPTPGESGQREHDIEIDTDLGEGHGPRAQMITQTVVSNGASASALDRAALDRAALDKTATDMTALEMTAPDDDAIQVSDDEIESAEPARPTVTSGQPVFADALSSSRPPAPSSLHPRASSTSLPPPRRSSRSAASFGSSLPPPSYPSLSSSQRAPWALANKALELSRANARISHLEDQIAFRDARILTLEERLDAAQLKIEEFERKRDGLPVAAPASSGMMSGGAGALSAKLAAPPSSLLAAPVARAASKPAIAIPKPADVAKAAEAKPTLARATNGKRETAREEDTLHSLTPDLTPDRTPDGTGAGEATADGRVSPEADAKQEPGAAVPPSGPEDVSRIAGIGARFEAALRKQGITSVRQIAAWSDSDVRQVAKALKIPKSRIVKGGWIEAAREMIGSRSTSE